MPSYRLEEASTGRAGCQNKECKDAKVKILKGELRHGSWIDTDRFQSFSWRHWGCVTPKVVSNMQELIADEGDGDPSVIDGFEDLSEENQDKVRKAIEQGHVDDADWKGDVEMNRPGKTGFRQRATKKKAKADEDDESAEEPAKPKKRTSKAAKDESDDEAPKAKKAKTAGRPKKAAAKDEEAEGEDGDATPAKSKAKQPAKKGRPTKETPEKKAAPAAKTGGRRQKKAAEDGDAEVQAEAEPEPAVAEKPKRGRKKKSA